MATPSSPGPLDDLRREIEELRASRARLAAVADEERRRIERDLHDGTQQHLVALAVNLELARQLVDGDPTAARALLDELGQDVREALESLRQLAQTVYPPLLLDRGLAEALRAAAAEAAIETRIEASALERQPAQVEATVHFCCAEALRNAARHAGPGARALVRVWTEQGVVRFTVEDDGAGFDVDATPRGAGLLAAGDLLGALGGRLEVTSGPGRGTRVSGWIPLQG